MWKRIALALLAISVRQASAQGSDAAAAALFEQGLLEMEQGKLTTACPQLAESFHLDPRAGTLFTLAECEARAGKIASATVHYADYVSRLEKMNSAERLKQRTRPAIAQKQLETLRVMVPTLTIEVLGLVPEGAVVRRDGIPLGAPSLGTPMPVDPGEHQVTMTLSDGRVLRESVVVKTNDKVRVRLAEPTAKPVSARTGAEVVAVSDVERSHVGWTLTAGILAASGLTVGTIAGALTLGAKDSIEGNCIGVVCNSSGKSAADSARSLGAVSTVGFLLGGIFAGITVALWITEPSGPKLRVGFNRIAMEALW